MTLETPERSEFAGCFIFSDSTRLDSCVSARNRSNAVDDSKSPDFANANSRWRDATPVLTAHGGPPEPRFPEQRALFTIRSASPTISWRCEALVKLSA